MKKHGFLDKLYSSKKGTKIVKEYLKTKFAKVLDTESISQFYHVGDVIVTKENGIHLGIEIKVDTHTTGNFAIELISNLQRNTIGCILKTSSKFLYYYFINEDICYIFNTKELQLWIENYGFYFSEGENEGQENWKWAQKIVQESGFEKMITSTDAGKFSYNTCGWLVTKTRLTNEVSHEAILNFSKF